MNVLIVCHCSETHTELYITNDIHKDAEPLNKNKNMQTIMKKYNINLIDYIEIRNCKSSSNKFWNQYTDWNDIKTMYDAIYFIHCPIYLILYDGYKMDDIKPRNRFADSTRQLLLNCFRVLKPKGYIHIYHNITNVNILPIDAVNNSQITKEEMINSNKKQTMRNGIKNLLTNHIKYKLTYKESKNINDIPFHIGIKKDFTKNIMEISKRYILLQHTTKKTKKNRK